MIRHSAASTDSEDSQALMVDMTTLLDIMFILLIFFILTAGASYRMLDLTLPQAVEEEVIPTKSKMHIMLEIKATGYAIDGKDYPQSADLKTAVQKIIQDNPEKELIIAGDRSVSLERLLDILTFLNSRGIETANILMQKKEAP